MSKFKRLVVKENEMLVSLKGRGSNEPLYVKVLKDETIYDQEGNEVGELFFSKNSKGNPTWGRWYSDFYVEKVRVKYIRIPKE